ncbi:Mycothione reductase [Corynebacterium ciconiae DSM 44920]|uniref:mycothione reductase n=1 Tax=Corynebacterium ciconiae TaxID=227319 RepID=UPI0003640164|nr:mycothione reductase [Corynebacterium ciconiae]WKD61459.1 Mycothione reductase [Corynebacterium ciconiae DSM 44920]
MATAAEKHYDLVIIGTGSGNSIPGPEFEDKSIAIVEKGTFGGTCLNVGCIPTKMFVYAAEQARAAAHSERYNLDTQFNSVDWPALRERVFGDRIDKIAAGGEEYRRGDETPNIDVYDGHARFVDTKTIATADGDTPVVISGEQIVLAVGSRPQIVPPYADSDFRYYTNEDIMRLEDLPKSIIIHGGGFIAAEFAHVFHDLGSTVTVINRSPRMMKALDADLTEHFTEVAEKTWNTYLGHDITEAVNTDDGVRVTLDDGTVLEADVFLAATGRVPNGDQLDAEKSGIELDGPRIKVDEYGRTSCEGVWALGDCSSPYLLKHVANAEMRAVRHNLLYPEDLRPMPHENVPSAVFTHPQIATVGLTEQQARDEGYDITVKIQKYGDVAYGWAMEDESNFVKLIADRATGQLLGAHFIGPEAATLIHQLITVMTFKLDVRQVASEQYWIHPALPELVENALLGLDFS